MLDRPVSVRLRESYVNALVRLPVKSDDPVKCDKAQTGRDEGGHLILTHFAFEDVKARRLDNTQREVDADPPCPGSPAACGSC
jgi:hypothetical protein